MSVAIAGWEPKNYDVPLAAVPGHFAGLRQSPYLLEYLLDVLRSCPRGGSTLEVESGSGYGAIWLSQRGIRACGIDASASTVERARQVNNILGGKAEFTQIDPFELFPETGPSADRVDVIHHQGLLEHYTVPQIRAILAQQVALADFIVFSVPSIHYPYEPEVGDERLLPIEEWQRILEPFDISKLEYYGDPRIGSKDHIRCILRGQPESDVLLALMHPGDDFYPNGISAIVHTRNEAGRIADCLKSLQGWADEIIVCDMESSDATVEIARQLGADVIFHPRVSNFDRARNMSSMHAKYESIFYLDADERVPPMLGQALRRAVEVNGDQFEAMLVPFRHHFVNHWMKCLYPGYTAPRLFKNGKFYFNPRLHSGARVDGRVIAFPADNPELAIVHYSYDSMSHYLDKINGYTTGEAESMYRDGHTYHWKHAVSHFVNDFQSYYRNMGAPRDGVHGFIYSFNSAFYRFYQHAKLYEQRFNANQLQSFEKEIPASLEEMLEYALAVARQKPRPTATPIPVSDEPGAASVVWCGPLHDPSGYGEESRGLLSALSSTGLNVAAQSLPWSENAAELTAEESRQIDDLVSKPVAPGFIQIVHNFPPLMQRHPEARLCIGRTTFETDRLPQEWVKILNRLNGVLVPTEFNRSTFADAGVDPSKIAVIPECLCPDDAAMPVGTTEECRSRVRSLANRFTVGRLTTFTYDPIGKMTGPAFESMAKPSAGPTARSDTAFRFLSVFDWTLHKGWDILLRAFFDEFADTADVELLLKVWSSIGYGDNQILEQAGSLVKERFDRDLAADPRIRFIFSRLSSNDMCALYRGSDCYVMPSRGEGWGRPYMEAMSHGLPVIGTNWSGNTAFMNADNSYLVDYTLQPVPEAAWREVPTYRGHCWAEPDLTHLRTVMRHVFEHPEERKHIGEAARTHVATNFSPEAVSRLIAEELGRLLVQTEPTARPVMQNEVKHLPGNSRLVTAKPDSELARVRWEGALFRYHSLGLVNCMLCSAFVADPSLELSFVPTEPDDFTVDDEPRFLPLARRVFAPLSGPATVHVRHHFPPRFDRPNEGRSVLILPWEYGYLPKAWTGPICSNVDEVWCHSRYVMDVYRNSGIPEQKLQLVPLGVDTAVFRPSAPAYIFTTEPGADRLTARRLPRERFVFLYTGGTIHRKGIDILLDAYLRAFSAADDVLLVVKDTGTNTVYPDNSGAKIKELCADRSRPHIIYLDDNLSSHQLAGIYTQANCIVQPYRGEGFCLPVLEAMACGVPAIVPEGGPTDDFVDETVGWRVAAARKPNPDMNIGPWECVERPWMFEIAIDDLVETLRSVRNNPEEARVRGDAASQCVREKWTWDCAAKIARARLLELSERPALDRTKTIIRPVDRVNLTETPTAREQEPTLSVLAPESTVLTVPKARNRRNGHSSNGIKSGKSQRGSSAATARAQHGPTISLCMIVKNEERVLGDCLASIKPYVDEIILVDTGSTDGTVAIAERHGAKVFHYPWTDSFSAARNESLKHATGDWNLWVDADDTIPEECGKRLHDLVLMTADNVTGLIMQVHIPAAPGEHGVTIVDHVKLFRNHLGLQFEGRIHEQILEPIHRIGGTVERTDLYVVHTNYDHSEEGQKKKRERDLRILELDDRERPDHPFVKFCYGMTYFHMRLFDKAIPYLERCLELSKPQESTIRKVYSMLTSSALETGDLVGARRWLEIGLAYFPKDPELLFRAGIIYRETGELQRAEQAYLRLLEDRETGHIDSLDVTMAGFKAHHNLGLIYREMGRFADAEAQWLRSLEIEPGFEPSRIGLAELDVLHKAGLRDAAVPGYGMTHNGVKSKQLESKLELGTRRS